MDKRALSQAIALRGFRIQRLSKPGRGKPNGQIPGIHAGLKVHHTHNPGQAKLSSGLIFIFSKVNFQKHQNSLKKRHSGEAHIAPEMSKVFDALRTAPLDTAAMAKSMGYPIYDLAKAGADSLFPVINMMNTRWFILPGQNNIHFPVENNAAYGNAWFVDDVEWVSNANEELSSLRKVSPRHTAVIDRRFSQLFDGKTLDSAKGDTTASIRQTHLASDEVTYEADSKKGGLVVFSEIYYPGWTATIDGQPANIGRADYVLRAMYVPAGKHTIHMEFHPKSVEQTELVANISFAALILVIAAAIFMKVRARRKE